MKALVTGASSGIGKEIAKKLSSMGYDLILVSRDIDKADFKDIKTKYTLIKADLSKKEEVINLYEKTKSDKIDILINNAGFGLFGEFNELDLKEELDMINLNIIGLHILTKLFLNDFIKRDSGYILNVSSVAAFSSGPLMATYYSTKAYVLRLTTSIHEELKKRKSNVKISVLCPGPTDTNFNKRANVKFKLKSATSKYVSDYAIKKMFKGKLIIVPILYMKTIVFLNRFVPTKLSSKISYKIQSKKR